MKTVPESRDLTVETSEGPARVGLSDPAGTRYGTLVLGHGAGKGTDTPDLQLLRSLTDDGWRVALVDQPWVLAGRRIAPRPAVLDRCWLEIIAELRSQHEVVGPLVLGGRSAGARVACRTAAELGAAAVVALAFPLVPPKKGNEPQAWRTGEAVNVIDAGVPLLVVQGARDRFGDATLVEGAVPGVTAVPVAGDHGFTSHPEDVLEAVRSFLGSRWVG